jgi:hypothetical protein
LFFFSLQVPGHMQSALQDMGAGQRTGQMQSGWQGQVKIGQMGLVSAWAGNKPKTRLTTLTRFGAHLAVVLHGNARTIQTLCGR